MSRTGNVVELTMTHRVGAEGLVERCLRPMVVRETAERMRRWGVTAEQLSRIVFAYSVTFWLGLFALGGLSAIASPVPAALGFPAPAALPVLGAALLLAVIAYLVATLVRREPLRLGRFVLPLPSTTIAVEQLGTHVHAGRRRHEAHVELAGAVSRGELGQSAQLVPVRLHPGEDDAQPRPVAGWLPAGTKAGIEPPAPAGPAGSAPYAGPVHLSRN